MNGALGSLCRVLGLVTVLLVARMDGWGEGNVFLAVLLGLLLANRSELGALGAVRGKAAVVCCLDGSAVGVGGRGDVLLLVDSIGSASVGQGNVDGGLAICIYLPGAIVAIGRHGLGLQRGRHPLRIGVGAGRRVSVAVARGGGCVGVGRIVALMLLFWLVLWFLVWSVCPWLVVFGAVALILLILLLLLVSRFGRRDHRSQKAMEEGRKKGNHGIHHRRRPSTHAPA